MDCLGQVFVYDLCVSQGWFFGLIFWVDFLMGHKRSTYTWVNTGIQVSSCYSVDVVRRNSVLVTHRSKRVNSVVLSDTDCCTRQCCGPGRPFEMRIVDNMQREVMHLSRPVRCQCCWLPCCLQEIEIQAPPGTVIGYVQQKWWYKI